MNRSPLLPTLTALLVLTSTAHALTPAGTEIVNQAQADFVPPNPQDPTQAVSNVVRTVVQAVCSVSVAPDGTPAQPGQRAALLPGERATFQYTVVNTGNTTETFPLTLRTESPSTISPATQLVRDLNGNGQADPDEPTVSTVTLAPDEQAAVLVVVSGAAQGEAYLNLVSSCAGTSEDSNNVSLVRVGPPPVLDVQKTFTPALVRPGTETTVTVTTTNTGQGESREVILTDRLAEQIARGLQFVPGSAHTNAGTLEYTQDGTTWSATEPSPVRGVRARVPALAPAAAVTLTFRMLATNDAENQAFVNTATAQTGAGTVSGSATADVRYQPAVAIGPAGTPDAPEGSPADQQNKPLAVAGQLVCFDHTARNTGDVRDTYRVTITYPQGGATATLYGENGQPLAQPITLEAGQSAPVRVCYDAQVGPLNALITIRGDRGTSNATSDVIGTVESGLPELRKAFEASTLNADSQKVVIPEGGTVATADTITYTLSVRNPYTRPLTNVVLTDPLPAHLDLTSASTGAQVTGQPGAQVVTWTLERLEAGETRTLTVGTRVSDRAVDGESLRNTFTMVSSELNGTLPSNEVQTPVWSGRLVIEKTVSAAEANYGDKLTYTLRITNQSTTTAITGAVVTDTPAPGLEYLNGTSTLNGQPLSDPSVSGGVLRWTAGELKPGQTATITYQTRVTPEAGSQIVNTVEVTGTGAGGARAVASNRATATTKLNPLKFAPLADIVGTVFVDRNRNGLFDPLLDLPVPRARLLLAGGREALTDARGRYAFPNVGLGTQALRLDPNTTPYPPLHVPQDGGLSGTQTVFVRGLTSADFPLAPLGGEINALRRTTLTMGDVRLEKTVYAVDGGYVVTLRLVTPRTLENLTLTDPLPVGAQLKEGRNIHIGTFGAGELNLTYRFDWTGEPRAATTDPVLSWRY
ncbi:DUF11 domain-containing protein [Deinococcus taeanensis]|uniref:isopeptide-forming domain-containing fimbrial protein n=1 Tax=Deinococcus taeanensis TaxID=2737050 RepID=UPI001CDBE416|nr:DUF11 domain-containing protein [Deinococcus taeanensis]UBV42788.1 DUF11 domain-containing protein [Deinococcus taeanensis]